MSLRAILQQTRVLLDEGVMPLEPLVMLFEVVLHLVCQVLEASQSPLHVFDGRIVAVDMTYEGGIMRIMSDLVVVCLCLPWPGVVVGGDFQGGLLPPLLLLLGALGLLGSLESWLLGGRLVISLGHGLVGLLEWWASTLPTHLPRKTCLSLAPI